MGVVKVHEFTTVDGIVDVPTWTAPYGFPADLAAAIGALTASASGILLGRRTYEMFAPAWSSRTVDDDPGAPFFNDSPKYVVSRTLTDPGWSNTTVLAGYDPNRIRELTAQGDLYVSGSATLVRAMLADGLVGELHLFVYPVALGAGIRLFPDGHEQLPLTLLAAARLSNGVAHLAYGASPQSGRPDR